MIIAARGQTDVGRKRDHNEDSYLVDEELGLFIVADGMGGHAGGGTASRLAVETIQERVRRSLQADPALFRGGEALEESPLREVLREAVEGACESIYRAAQGDPSLAGMGTTVTAVLVSGRNTFIAHVGDSRCYLVRRSRIYQVSDPHSWQTAGDVEHAQILQALIDGDEPGALIGMAHHLARTALRVLADCAPGYEPAAVTHAVALIEDGRPAPLP